MTRWFQIVLDLTRNMMLGWFELRSKMRGKFSRVCNKCEGKVLEMNGNQQSFKTKLCIIFCISAILC
jgi:hypothetical protein